MKHIFHILAFVALSFVACDKVTPDIETTEIDMSVMPNSISLTKAESEMTADINSFAFKLYDELLSTSGYDSKPVIISPFSVSLALSMTAIGAGGNTAAEMLDVLGFKGYTTEEMNAFYQKMTSGLTQADKYTSLEIANAIWASKLISVKKDFASKADTYYDSKVSTADFTSSKALKDINDWVSDKTHGLIKSILEELDPQTKMILCNALYFKSTWRYKFDDDYVKETFTDINGKKDKMDMLCLTGNGSGVSPEYHSADGYEAVTLPYGSGAFEMTLILHPEDKPFGSTTLTYDSYRKLMSSYKDVIVTKLKMPEFKVEDTYDMTDMLPAIGIKDAFNPVKADFSGISDTDLYISFVKHKAYIDVNRTGTEAAAITAIGMKDTAPAPVSKTKLIEVTIDRPFSFVISEKSTGAILFMGQKTLF